MKNTHRSDCCLLIILHDNRLGTWEFPARLLTLSPLHSCVAIFRSILMNLLFVTTGVSAFLHMHLA